MTGLELLAAAAVGYLVRKARQVSGRADSEVDAVLDAGLDRLHDVVARALGNDPVFDKLEQEARAGAENPRTLQRVQLAIEEAADADATFAELLQRTVENLQAADPSAVARAGDHSVAAGGNVMFTADRGGIAGVIHGTVSTGNPIPPGPAMG